MPQSSLSSSTLQLRAFNDTLSNTMGTTILPLKVGCRSLHILFHAIEGDLQYNILLGRPWIDEMRCIPSTLHQCINFIHERKLTCVKIDSKPFQYCNFIPSFEDLISSTCLVPLAPSSSSSNVVVTYNVVSPNVVVPSHFVSSNVDHSNVASSSEVPSINESWESYYFIYLPTCW